MRTFKNTRFQKRDAECIHVVACVGEVAPDGYEACGEDILKGLTSLWVQAGVRYYGYL